MKRIKLWWAKLTKKAEPASAASSHQDIYAPRRSNTIYPNDEFAYGHVNKWLDDVLDKHHG